MKFIRSRYRPALVATFVCALYFATGGFMGANTWAQNAKPSVNAREPVTLNFVNAEIEAVANTLAALNGKQVVVDPRVKGTITLVTKGAVSPTAALTQFLSALRVLGFTMVEVGGLYKVVPEADAKLQGGGVSAGPAPSGGSQILTQIFKLNYESASNLVPVLRPLISPNNTINVNTGTNSLVITDYADNLHRLGRIIAALDVANATEVQVIPIRNVAVTDIAPMILRLLETSTGGASGTGAAGGGRYGPAHHRDRRAAQQCLDRAGLQCGPLAIGCQTRRKPGYPHTEWPKWGRREYLCGLPQKCRCHQTRHGAACRPDRHGCCNQHPCGSHGYARHTRQCRARQHTAASQHRRTNPGRYRHQFADHHRIRTAVPPTARGD